MVGEGNVNNFLREKSLKAMQHSIHCTGAVSCCVCAFNCQAQRGLSGLLQSLQTLPWALLFPERQGCIVQVLWLPCLGGLVPPVAQGVWIFVTPLSDSTQCPASLPVLPLNWKVKTVCSFDRLELLRVLKYRSMFSFFLSPLTLLPSFKKNCPYSSSLLFAFALDFIHTNVCFVLTAGSRVICAFDCHALLFCRGVLHSI